MKTAFASFSDTAPTDKPHHEALRSLSHALSRWSMFGHLRTGCGSIGVIVANNAATAANAKREETEDREDATEASASASVSPIAPILSALGGAEVALYQPLQDRGEDEAACEAALRALLSEFVRVFTESDKLTASEAEAVWLAQAYVDGLDEAARVREVAAQEEEARRCYAAAQREHRRPARNGERRRREERERTGATAGATA